jgi:hypothetical protein
VKVGQIFIKSLHCFFGMWKNIFIWTTSHRTRASHLFIKWESTNLFIQTEWEGGKDEV